MNFLFFTVWTLPKKFLCFIVSEITSKSTGVVPRPVQLSGCIVRIRTSAQFAIVHPDYKKIQLVIFALITMRLGFKVLIIEIYNFIGPDPVKNDN